MSIQEIVLSSRTQTTSPVAVLCEANYFERAKIITMIYSKVLLLAVFMLNCLHVSNANKGFYSFSVTDIEGKQVALSKYSGKASTVYIFLAHL